MRFVYPEGATPIDEDEAAGLIPDHVTLQRELNEWESQNIQKAMSWSLSRKRNHVLTLDFVRNLHKRMFNETWTWAGQFRKSDKNIGVGWDQIAVETQKLLDDTRWWLDESVYSIQESALRLHYRMVTVHPFVNGNGRHARLLADILLFNNGKPGINWGATSLDSTGTARKRYIDALRAADADDIEPLLSFIR
ncbi:mobile mystery protein B [Gemmatimonadota bacterium]